MLDLERDQSLAAGVGAPARGTAAGVLIRRVREGEPWRPCDHGRRDPRAGRPRPCVFDGGLGQLVLTAHQRGSLVGSAHASVVSRRELYAWKRRAAGGGKTGPFFWPDAGEEHVLLLRSLWVTPPARRSGVAAALCGELGRVGMPGWATFPERWVAAWLSRRFPPERGRGCGHYHTILTNWPASTHAARQPARARFCLGVTIVDWASFVAHVGEGDAAAPGDQLTERLVDTVRGVFDRSLLFGDRAEWQRSAGAGELERRGFAPPTVRGTAQGPGRFSIAITVDVADTGRLLAYVRLVAFLQTLGPRPCVPADVPRVLAAAVASRMDWFADVELVSLGWAAERPCRRGRRLI